MSMDRTVLAQVASLPSMDLQDINVMWEELFKEPAPRAPKTFLVKKLAYRLQELAYGMSASMN